jgi:large subunit ribosomal protein L25
MTEVTPIAAQTRQQTGKGAARATRRNGRVPAVIYGNKEETLLISLDPMDLSSQLKGPGFFARVFEIQVDKGKHRVLARDLQLDPVSDWPIHVDFMRFSADTKLNIDVQVIFENEAASPGLKRGGVLNIVRHAIELVCSADNIPECISIDLSGLEIGDSVHISDVELPAGVEPTIADRDFTVATIAAPSVLKTVEEEEAEAAALALAEEEEGLEGEEAVEGEEAEGEKEDGGKGEGEGGN